MTTRTVVLQPVPQYYINGERVSRQVAKDYLSAAADRQGYESENWAHAWANANRSEESREFLSELSGFALEIVPTI